MYHVSIVKFIFLRNMWKTVLQVYHMSVVYINLGNDIYLQCAHIDIYKCTYNTSS